MAQFTVVFNNGATSLVYASDKYEAIEKAKEKQSQNKTGVREVKDCNRCVFDKGTSGKECQVSFVQEAVCRLASYVGNRIQRPMGGEAGTF